MKSIFLLIAFMVSMAHAEGQTARVPLYGLACPGQDHLISSIRSEWQSQGHTILARFSTLAEEVTFHDQRIATRSLRFKYSYLPRVKSAKELERERYGLENAWNPDAPVAIDQLIQSGGVEWREGIRIEPASQKLPNEVRGCKVVPVIIPKPDFDIKAGKNQTKSYGSSDDFSRLYPIDQLLMLWATNAVPPDLTRLMVNEEFDGISWRDKYSLMITSRWYSMAYRGLEIGLCEWSESGLPSLCSLSMPRIYDSPEYRKVEFDNKGRPYRLHIGRESLVSTPVDLTDAKAGRINCHGSALYYPNGRIRSCNNLLLTEDGKELLASVHNEELSHLQGLKLREGYSVIARDYEGQALAMQAQDRFEQISFNPKAPLNDLQKYELRHRVLSSPVVELHPDGHFRSGLVDEIPAPSQKPQKYIPFDPSYYIVASPEGKILHKEKVQKNEELDLDLRLVRNESKELKAIDAIKLQRGELSSRVPQIKILISEKQCPAPVLNKTQITLAPGCAAVVLIFFGVQKSEGAK